MKLTYADSVFMTEIKTRNNSVVHQTILLDCERVGRLRRNTSLLELSSVLWSDMMVLQRCSVKKECLV